ncbi:MAG: DinB family protein [Ferruginibacter sp.]
MQTQTIASPATEQIINLITKAWAAQNKRVSDFFDKYSDDAYLNEIAPGRNRAIYLLGHLTAINDALLPLFGFGEKLFPELEEPFLTNADKTNAAFPSLTELKQYWQTVNTTLTAHFNKLTSEEWLDKHTAVSAEDFAINPERNRLNVLIGRTNHQSYHLGQLNLLRVKVE